MRKCDVSLSSLLPIQEGLTRSTVEELRVSTRPLPRIMTLPYGTGSLTLDGHHRAAAHYRRGNIAVPSFVIESDADVRRLETLGFCYLSSLTIPQIMDVYFDEWLPECRTHGVETFYDLLVRNNLHDIPKNARSRAHAGF